MQNNSQSKKNQINIHKLYVLEKYFSVLKIGSLLNQAQIKKVKGASPLELFSIIFNMAFWGKNLFEGVVRNKNISIGKDAVYNFLNSPTYNWRKFTLLLFSKIYFFMRKYQTSDNKEEVLIFDDSTYDRSRSKSVELLSRVFDHTTKKFLKGFRMLTLAWSDGNSCLGFDFILLSSAKKEHRYQEINPDIDKRTCGYKRRKEAVTKSTEHLEPMIKRALNLGIKARYVLMDSWFSMPSVISDLRKHIHVICMLKDHPKYFYLYKGKKLRLSDLYSKLVKKRGKARVKASVVVKLTDGNSARIIFVPADKKRGWLALLSTDTEIDDLEIIRLYGKRWDIEVFFKMCKQHLKLVKEVQLRSYDGLIAHTSIVIARYNILSLFQRQNVDPKSFGDLFRQCCEELTNISFIEAFRRIISLAMDSFEERHQIQDNILNSVFDRIINYAIVFFGLSSTQESLILGDTA